LPRVEEGSRMGRQVAKSCFPAPIIGGKVKAWITPRISSFYVGGPSSSAKSGGALSSMRCRVPQPFAAGGNQLYP
jgi:hypothetical protein